MHQFQLICSSLLLTLGIQIVCVLSVLQRNIEEENAPLFVTESVQGTIAKLPCNITPPLNGDRVALVIWYKEQHPKPIYSFDTRQTEKGLHWVGEHFGGRAHFQPDTNPAILTIQSTKNVDSGIYRCRVDFQKSPTRNSKVQLRVIIPPEKLVILDNTGNHIPHYILGPYNEDSSINITCVSTGGYPLPNVTWWHENTLLDDTSNFLSDRRVSNVLRLEKLQRRHLHMVLTCQAANNNLTTPISSSITLDMNLKPLWIKLEGENHPLSAESSYQLRCIIVGSRPAPTITWWKGSTLMRNTHEITSSDGNLTTSILTFTPKIDDRGKFLSCRAENTLIPESGIEDGWKLDIYHVPVVTLEFGTSSNNTIREGADVYFECNIKSNPWIYRVSWRHNGKLLDNNQLEGIIVANQSLVLQNISRARSGIYTCTGSNREGDGESNPVQLDIQFAPICRPGQRTTYSISRGESTRVICEVEANPTNVSYIWRFNTSNYESIDLAASQIVVDGPRSITQHIARTEQDYGTLLCWGTNEVGSQSEPCVFNIIPAVEPDPLAECIVLNQTSNSFRVECLEGYDNSLEQDFIMEVYINGSTRNPKIFKSRTPHFEVHGLTPGMTYNVFLVAQNKKGRSNSTILQIYTLKDPEKQTAYISDLSMAYAPVIEDIRRFLVILLGVVGFIFLIALTIVVVVRMRGSSGRDRQIPSHNLNRDNFHNNQRDPRLNRDIRRNSTESIERNPDIIPQDNRDEDDDEEWTTSNMHTRSYTTAALAEQHAYTSATSSYDRLPYGVVDNRTLPPSQPQHQHSSSAIPQQIQDKKVQLYQHAPQYIKTYNTLVPVSRMANVPQSQNTAVTYAELTLAAQNAPNQRIPYCTSTLGRPRHFENKRNEPTIYAQIDLAHHPVYPTNPLHPRNSNTNVTMSHPSELATFFPTTNYILTPSSSSSKFIGASSECHSVTEMTSFSKNDPVIVTSTEEMQNTNVLPTVAEEVLQKSSEAELPAGAIKNQNFKNKNHATRF